MSSRGRRQAGFDRESEHRRARDHRDSHRPAAQRDNEYAESELSYISAFEDLNLNSARNAQYPTATTSPSRLQNLPAHPYHGELRPSMQRNMQSMEPQLEHGIDAHNSLGLVPGNHINRAPSGSPSRPFRQNVENPYNAYYSRQEGHASPSWWQSPAEFARPPERGFQGYRPYPEEDRFIGSRRTEMPLECQCHTCVEHRHGIRNWAISRYDNRGMPPRSNYYPYTYPGQPSRGRYPIEVDRLYRNPYDSRDNDSDYSSYESDTPVRDGYRNYPVPNSRQPNRRTADPRNVYYESDGSGHEDSDNASYTGYERYDEYGDEYGEYEGGGYSD
ncbi:hypothetical protein JOM56_008819 [Amanita muscaria]